MNSIHRLIVVLTDPPQSNFINSIIAVLMLYPPVSKSNPLPTTPNFLLRKEKPL